MLVKSTWSNSKGEVTRISCSAALAQAPSCWIHLSQLLMALSICIVMPDHQNQSYNRDRFCCWPWCPVFLWHPFMVTTLWAVGTTNHIASSSSLAGVWWWIRAPSWSVNFILSSMAIPSSTMAWSLKRCFRSCAWWKSTPSQLWV